MASACSCLLLDGVPCNDRHVACVVLRFCTFLFNAHFDLEPDYITSKAIRRRIQRCNLRRKILTTFHTQVDHRSVRPFAIQNNKPKIPKNAGNHARNSPFPFRHVDFHLTHECLGPPHSPRQTTARSLYAPPHNDATKSPLRVQNRRVRVSSSSSS